LADAGKHFLGMINVLSLHAKGAKSDKGNSAPDWCLPPCPSPEKGEG